MASEDPHSVIELTEPRALRAYAHPLRLRLVGLLRREGPLTATEAGERLGESPASCSFHLRQLARYGLVEEAGGGRGRQRPWRATARATSWPSAPTDPDVAAASDALSHVVAERYADAVHRWIDRRADEPEAWQEAVHLGDSILFLTSEELAQLGRDLEALFAAYADRLVDAAVRPEGSRPITFLRLAFPTEP